MAKSPMPSKAAAAPAAPSDMGDDSSMTDAGGDDAGDSADSDGGEDSGMVLLTVCKEADGTYTLIKGDEDDTSDAGGDAGGDMGAEADATGAQGDDSQGTSYDGKGPLLKAILDLLNADDSEGGGDSAGEDSFQAGFGGAGSASATGGTGGAGGAGTLPALANKF